MATFFRLVVRVLSVFPILPSSRPNVMRVAPGGARYGEEGALSRPGRGKMADVEVLGAVEGEVCV